MAYLPNITGLELAAFRKAHQLTQTVLAQAVGVSLPTVQRAEAEKNKPIGSSLARRLSVHLLVGEPAWLELGLGPVALEFAEQQGLRAWRYEPAGFVYWRPGMHEWAARFRRFQPRSRSSQARHLCDLLGLDEREGLVLCAMCEEHGATQPSVAFRRCSRCPRLICGSASCGESLAPGPIGPVSTVPVICHQCRDSALGDDATYGASSFVLPGSGEASYNLEQRFQLVRAQRRPVDVAALQSDIEKHISYYEAHLMAIDGYMEGEIPTPKGLPDFYANLRIAHEEAENELARLRILLSRVAAT